MTDAADRRPRRSFLGRALGAPVEAARGVLEDQVTGTARSVVDELEPYLTAETVPRVVDALVPHLVEKVVPEVLDSLTEHLGERTVPAVLRQATPQLADELVPALLDRLRPHLEAELVPAVVDGVTPHLVEVTVPRVTEALLPRLTAEVVPAVLDGLVDDPRVRELIRQQSTGLLRDAFDRLQDRLARLDDAAESAVRRIRVREPVADPVPAAELLPGRTRSHAGIVSRAVGGALDLLLISFGATLGLAAALQVLDVLLDSVPDWLATTATVLAALTGPVYLTLAWTLVSCTVGSAVAGYDVVARAGGPLPPVRAAVRALLALAVPVVWAFGLLGTTIDGQRRSWLDRVVGSRAPYDAGPARVPVPPAAGA